MSSRRLVFSLHRTIWGKEVARSRAGVAEPRGIVAETGWVSCGSAGLGDGVVFLASKRLTVVSQAFVRQRQALLSSNNGHSFRYLGLFSTALSAVLNAFSSAHNVRFSPLAARSPVETLYKCQSCRIAESAQKLVDTSILSELKTAGLGATIQWILDINIRRWPRLDLSQPPLLSSPPLFIN